MGMTPSSFVEAAVPLDETFDTSLDGRPRPKAEVSFDIRGVGPRDRDISRLKREEVHVGPTPQCLFDDLYELYEANGAAVTDIVNPIGGL